MASDDRDSGAPEDQHRRRQQQRQRQRQERLFCSSSGRLSLAPNQLAPEAVAAEVESSGSREEKRRDEMRRLLELAARLLVRSGEQPT